MKTLLFLFFSTSSLFTHANEFDFDKELNLASLGPQVSYCGEFGDPIISYALSSAYREHKANCSKFINSKGELGPHGKEIFDHLDSISNSQYFEDSYNGMRDVCPRWSKFSKVQKKYFWVWFFAGIAWKEATCKETEINAAATHGVAVGYLQLNEKQSDRKWRGDDSGKSCAKPEVKSAVNNLKCGVEIFNEQLQGRDGIYKGNGSLAGKGSSSYWQDLRGAHSKVLQMVKGFPGCKN